MMDIHTYKDNREVKHMNKAMLCIILGATLWGTIGWYVKNLYQFGFTPMEVVMLRAWTAALLLLLYLAISSPKSLRLNAAGDIRYFVGTGICSIIFFNYCMFTAIELSTIPIATALLYTAPAFVTVLSVFLFKERFTKNKGFALVMTLLGACLVVGVSPAGINDAGITAIMFGIGSGFGYALYSIFSKFALEKYTSMTITTYTFVVAAVVLLPFFPYAQKGHLLAEPGVIFFAFGLGLLPTAFAYIIYTYGLTNTEASKAAILSTVEPVVAVFIGIFVFQESFSPIQIAGMVFILSAVLLVQKKRYSSSRV